MFPPIEELIAHRGNMLLIDHVLTADDRSIRVAATVDPSAWYADANKAMPAWIGIELMAQAIGALVGLTVHASGLPPKQGLLLGTRALIAHMSAFPAGARLEVTAQEVFRETNGLAAFDTRIELNGETVVTATLKVFEPADIHSILETQ